MFQRRPILKWLAVLLSAPALAAAGVLLLTPAAPPRVAPFPWQGTLGRPFLIAAGGAPSAPPYTLPAFRRALADGVQALALPLRFTADGEPVVYPAGDLSATTDGHGAVEALPLADLQTLDAGYRFADPPGAFSFRGHGLQIPLFEEVLAAFPGTPMLVELVDPSPAPAHLDRLARIVKRWEVSGTILLAARSREVAATLRRLIPEAPAVSTPEEAASFLTLARLGLAAFARPAYHLLWAAPEALTARVVGAAHRRRLAVLAGPAASPEEARRLLALKVEGLILTGRAMPRRPR
ncbi:MAG: glycerophosphodiester phosphodiesterase family protein [Bacillota bacterium]|nr:glycerophosphodiester phosphodiesterase family protein [Bacillota bacterium]